VNYTGVSWAIVILNWNNGPDTIRCVRAIKAWQELRPAIWVVDDGPNCVLSLR
jgi:GT2 family glycosyltransferase